MGNACQKSPPAHRPATSTRPADDRSTVLSSYPLRDAISILILLLSLPPTLVLVIQALFTSLTFVPPTTSASVSALPNVKELFNSSNMGYPAMATILIVDVIFWLCWLPVWRPVQGMFLDMSHAVIAVSLSGSAARSGGPSYSIAACMVTVFAVHVLRYKAIHLTALDYLRSVIFKIPCDESPEASPFDSTFFSSSPRGWLYAVIRTALGIHIVSQGVTTCIRRFILKANEQSASFPAAPKLDAELSPGIDRSPRSPVPLEESPSFPPASSTDGRPPGPSPASSDSKPREPHNKRKRKQANQARSHQPLWAAVASTKVTFVKEMEHRDAIGDAREASKVDILRSTNISHGQPTNTASRIWICEVRDTEILFMVELATGLTAENAQEDEVGPSPPPGVDRSKPFYLRINGAAWSSTRIEPGAAQSSSDKSECMQFEGEIFGLAPVSSYHCEVLGINSQQTLCSVSIITQPVAAAEQAPSTTHPQHQALRPSSPITTLKQSIQSAEAKLNETRSRMKKNKKDQRSMYADIKREINSLRSKLEPSGGADDKLERRIVQISQHKNQAEEATAETKSQIEALGDAPQNDVARSETVKQLWRAARDAKDAATKDLDLAKSHADRDLSALKAEISQVESKRDKAEGRLAQRTREWEKLAKKQEVDMTAKQQREFDRAQTAARREEEERVVRLALDGIENEMLAIQGQCQEAAAEVGALQHWSTQPPPYPGYSSLSTPDLSLANSTIGSSYPAGMPLIGPPSFPPAVPPIYGVKNRHTAAIISEQRGRSASMLSLYSGFTDAEPDDPGFGSEQKSRPQHPPTGRLFGPDVGAFNVAAGKESEGSGSLHGGSTGSNSPRPDGRPFVPTKATPLSPIGTPSKQTKTGDKAAQGLLRGAAAAHDVDGRR